MITSLKKMIDLKIKAKDGEIGKATDFYFDDVGWNIRYLVAETGGLLTGREVLISHFSMRRPSFKLKTLPVDLPVEKIKNSPAVESKLPVSRKKEQELAAYYAWPLYWMNMTAIPPQESILLRNMWSEEMIEKKNKEQSMLEAHLRSFAEVKGYNIEAIDDNIGQVDDFLVDDITWKIRYMVIDTRKWFPGGKNVLISPAWIENVDWNMKTVKVDQKKKVIKNSPVYNEDMQVKPEFEVDLFIHYGKQ